MITPGDPGKVVGPTLVVARAEYERLQSLARQYANLRQNLIAGGVSEETISVLSRNHDQPVQPDPDDPAQPHRRRPAPPIRTQTPAAAGPGGAMKISQPFAFNAPQTSGRTGVPGYDRESCDAPSQPMRTEGACGAYSNVSEWANAVASHDEGISSLGTPTEQPQDSQTAPDTDPQPSRLQYDKYATRTLLFSHLAEGASYGDVVAAVRGGVLLDVFLKPYDRSATVSFLHQEDAKRYLEHVRRRDLYIKNKRVDVGWAERQFVLHGYVASKIKIGATRNLVIRRCNRRLTEEAVRDDLEHIHNLVVIKVTFVGQDCHISTNSAPNAMFARTCMMSRLKYRASRIEWDIDECAQPLEPVAPRNIPKENVAPRSTLNPRANRFELLKLEDESEIEDLDGDGDGSTSFHTHASANINA